MLPFIKIMSITLSGIHRLINGNNADILKRLRCRHVRNNITHNEIHGAINNNGTLKLCDYIIGSDFAIEIAKLIKGVHILHEINISHNRIMVKDMNPIIKSIGPTGLNNSLHILNLSYNMVEYENIVEIANILKTNTSMHTLNLHSNNIEDKGAILIAESLLINTSLRILILSSNKIKDEGAISIAQALTVNTSLHILCLGYNKISTRFGDALETLLVNMSLHALLLGMNNIYLLGIVKVLAKNTSLRILDLDRNIMDIKSTTKLAVSLSVNVSLHVLDLSNNNIDDEGICAVAKSLTNNTSLQILNLSRCSVGSSGTIEIAKLLLVNTTLQELNLDANNIGYGSIAIAESLCTNKFLHKLSLYNYYLSQYHYVNSFGW